jgi:hypothetical protein
VQFGARCARRNDTEGYDTTQPQREQEPEGGRRSTHSLRSDRETQLDIKTLDNSQGLIYNEGDDATISSDEYESVV